MQAFLEQRIRFTDIAVVVEQALEQVQARVVDTLATVLEDDARARAVAETWIAARVPENL